MAAEAMDAMKNELQGLLALVNSNKQEAQGQVKQLEEKAKVEVEALKEENRILKSMVGKGGGGKPKYNTSFVTKNFTPSTFDKD